MAPRRLGLETINVCESVTSVVGKWCDNAIRDRVLRQRFRREDDQVVICMFVSE